MLGSKKHFTDLEPNMVPQSNLRVCIIVISIHNIWKKAHFNSPIVHTEAHEGRSNKAKQLF